MRCYSSIKVIALVALLTPRIQSKTTVNLDLYYESLCPDSMNFVKTQLVPTFPAFKDHLSVTYIPYGKATHSKKDQSNGTWEFVCQHGPAECRGNRAQACGIHEILSTVRPDDQQQRLVDLVGCIMTNQDPASAITLCIQQIGLSEESKNRIVDCELNSLGNDLLANYGDKTRALVPTLTFVPTIVINGVYSEENQYESLIDLRTVICRNISVDERPAVCKIVN